MFDDAFPAQVAAKALETAVFGACYNVTINLKDIMDEDFKKSVSTFVSLFMLTVAHLKPQT